jgi:hypothetical protein
MKRRQKRKRWVWGAAVSGLAWELLWRWASREPRWIQSYYYGITGAWSPSLHDGGR